MNSDASQPPPERSDREARLTALLLGELPADEAESLRAEIAADPELTRLFGRLRLASELTRDTVRQSAPKDTTKPEPLQLSPERRAALLARFREAPANVVPLPAPQPAPAFDRRELLALAAMLVVLLGAGALVAPALLQSGAEHATPIPGFDHPTETAAFSTQLSHESLPEKPAQTSMPASPDSEPRAIRRELELGRKRVEDKPAQSVPPASPPEPMLAQRYGLSRAAGAHFTAALPPSTPVGPPDANAVQLPEAGRPLAEGAPVRGFALADETKAAPRPPTDGSPSRGLAVASDGLRRADFDSKSGRADSNGREAAAAQGQIVLPPLVQRESWDDRPAVSLFFEQAPQDQGRGLGAGGGGAMENRWFVPEAPTVRSSLGDAPAAGGLVRSHDESKALATDVPAPLAQEGRLLMEKGQLDDAEAKLTEAIKSNPESEAAHYYLGLIKEQRSLGESKQREVATKDKLVQVEPGWGAGAGFGGGAGNRPNFGSIQLAPPPPAPSAAVGFDLSSPAPAIAQFTTPTTADGAVRELSAESAPPKPAASEERLGRAAGRIAAEDRKAGAIKKASRASTEPSPQPDARGEIVAAAPSINGPVSSVNPLPLDAGGVALRAPEGQDLGRYQAKVDAPVDSRSVVTGVNAGATPEPPKLTTFSGRLSSGRRVGAERLQQPVGSAGSATERQVEGEKLADFGAGQGVTVAAKPAARPLDIATKVTNAALPNFGDAFGIQRDVKAAEEFGEHLEGKNEFQGRLRLRSEVLSKKRQSKLDTGNSQSSGVEIIEPASADSGEKPGLFAKLRQTFGGDATRAARVKIEKDAPDVSLLGVSPGGYTYDPYYLNTQEEVIRSKKILGEAAKRLNLATENEEGFRQLEGKVSVHQFSNTTIADIQVKDPDPAKAADIANAVAQVYAEYRNSIRVKRDETREKLGPIANNEAGVAQARETVDRLRQELKIPELTESDKPLPKLAAGAPEPQPEVATADNAFSTFSLNVSDVSFKLAAASLEKGQMPDPSTVRTEEFINAFDYHDPELVGAAPISFTWERARYPFAHDRDLLRFSIKTAASGRQPGRPLNLVLALDNSGSMERADRVRIRQECLRVLAGQLQPQDRVSVVAFARSARLWVDGLPGSQAAELPGRVGELTPDGGTNLEEALRLAYQTAARHFTASGINRVVLLTDGAANLGDVQPDSLKQQVEANRRQGIALDCFGIGWEGFNDELLEVLSRNGDGRYGFVNTPEAATSEFAQQLVGALQVAASDVKVQVEWNPRRVTAYRQLGYAKHQLTKEQFRDNTVDAAEIGAAEAGNALYTVQVNPSGEGPLGTVRLRFRVPGTGDYREHAWPLDYNGTACLLEQAGPALRLAGSASAFSEWLVSSPHAAEVTPDRLLALLTGVSDTYAADPRPKQFEQMLRQAKSLTGK